MNCTLVLETRRKYLQAGPAQNHRFWSLRGAKQCFAWIRYTHVGSAPASLLVKVSSTSVQSMSLQLNRQQ